jgi:hypothetical protein
MAMRRWISITLACCVAVSVGLGLGVGWLIRQSGSRSQCLPGPKGTPTLPNGSAPPAELLQVLQRPLDLRMGHRISDIPDPVRTAFARAAQIDKFEMAEPGARWQATDVILWPPAPRRRLRSVAKSDSFVLLFYELGGFGESQNVAAFRLSRSTAEPIWHAYLYDCVTSPDALRAEVDEGRAYGSPLY